MQARKRGFKNAAADFAGLAKNVASGRRKKDPLPEENLKVVIVLSSIVEAVTPYTDMIYNLAINVWKALEPYHPEELAQLLYGFILTFFGVRTVLRNP